MVLRFAAAVNAEDEQTIRSQFVIASETKQSRIVVRALKSWIASSPSAPQ
jgi:hypothetical protein